MVVLFGQAEGRVAADDEQAIGADFTGIALIGVRLDGDDIDVSPPPWISISPWAMRTVSRPGLLGSEKAIEASPEAAERVAVSTQSEAVRARRG